MKLLFSPKKILEKPGKKKTHRRHHLLTITRRAFVSSFMKPNKFLTGSFRKPKDSLIPKLFQIPRTKGFFCCPDFGFQCLKPTGIKKM